MPLVVEKTLVLHCSCYNPLLTYSCNDILVTISNESYELGVMQFAEMMYNVQFGIKSALATE